MSKSLNGNVVPFRSHKKDRLYLSQIAVKDTSIDPEVVALLVEGWSVEQSVDALRIALHCLLVKIQSGGHGPPKRTRRGRRVG